ncbi:MAG: TonB-dependent receptor [Pedobacter sp.]|nr:TonB-dependent receptor [Pedobacter sp.]
MKFSASISLPLLPLAAAIALCTTAYAEEATTLPEVVVAATRLNPETAGTPLYIIERQDIERSTARNLSQLLTSVPGLSVQQLTGSTGKEGSVDLRGFGATASSNTLILVDGRRLNDIDISATDINGIPMDSIERIEIQPGGGSVLYGDGASGGTINIITRRPVKSGAAINLAAGSFDTQEATASAQLVSQGIALGVSGQHQKTDGYRENSDVERNTGGANLSFQFGQQELFLQGQVSKLESGLPAGRTVDPDIGLDQLHNDPRGTSTPDDYANEDRTFLIAGWKMAITDSLSVIIDGSQRNKQQQSYFGDYAYGHAYDKYVDAELDTVSLTPRINFSYASGPISNNLRAGLDWYQTDYRSSRGQRANTAPIHIISIDSETTSPYLFQTSKWKKTSLSLGARQSRVKQSGTDTYDSSAPGAFDSAAAPGSQTYKEGMYEAGLSQELGAGFTGMLSASRSVRLGTVDEVYESDPVTYQPVFSPLLPQTAHNLEGSLVYTQAKSRIVLTGYEQKLKNEIMYDPVAGTNDNLDPTLRRGITLNGTTELFDRVTLNASLTKQEAKFREGLDAENTIPLVPEHLAYIGVNWQIISLINLAVSDTYTGGKYMDNDQTNDFDLKIPSYHRVDARLGLTWHQLAAGFSIYNIGNSGDHYDYGIRSLSPSTPNRYSGSPLPGREYRFDVGFKF